MTESPSLAVAIAYNNAILVGAQWHGEPMRTHHVVFDDQNREAHIHTTEEPTMSTVNLDAHRSEVALLQWCKARKAEIAEVEKKARAEIEDAMGDNEAGTVDGELAITWQTSKRRSLDQEALKRDHPILVEEYKKTTEVRTFRVHD